MNIWIFTPIGVGVVLFFYSLIMAFRIAFKARQFTLQVFLNILLTVVSIAWISLGVYAYFIIQSQMAN